MRVVVLFCISFVFSHASFAMRSDVMNGPYFECKRTLDGPDPLREEGFVRTPPSLPLRYLQTNRAYTVNGITGVLEKKLSGALVFREAKLADGSRPVAGKLFANVDQLYIETSKISDDFTPADYARSTNNEIKALKTGNSYLFPYSRIRGKFIEATFLGYDSIGDLVLRNLGVTFVHEAQKLDLLRIGNLDDGKPPKALNAGFHHPSYEFYFHAFPNESSVYRILGHTLDGKIVAHHEYGRDAGIGKIFVNGLRLIDPATVLKMHEIDPPVSMRALFL